MIASDVRSVRLAREADIAKRKTGLIGVSDFPDVSSRSVETDVADYSRVAKWLRPEALPGQNSVCEPLAPWKAAGAFERLRARAEAFAKPPTVFLATLGTPAEHSARVAFARNMFAAGGIVADVGTPKDYAAAQTPIAVICASDAVYTDQAAAAAVTLKASGVDRIYLAGRPGALEAALREDGVEHFLYAGMDIVAALDEALAILERFAWDQAR